MPSLEKRLQWFGLFHFRRKAHQELYFAAQNGKRKKLNLNSALSLSRSLARSPSQNPTTLLPPQSRLGGGEGVEGLYGSITRTGTARVLSSLTRHSGLDSDSHLVDVGAGLGRPLLHALADPGVAMASGVELDPVKCEKAEAFAVQARAALLLRKKTKTKEHVEEKKTAEKADNDDGGGRGDESEEQEEEREEETWTLPAVPDIQCCPVEALPSLDPATHVYSFWEGVPPRARAAFGELVARSRTVRGVAVVQRAMRSRGGNGGGGGGGQENAAAEDAENDGESEPSPSSSSPSSSIPEAVMRDYGFGKLELRDSFAVSMSGSGRSFRAYVFSREVVEDAAAAAPPRPPALAAAAADSGASEQTAAAAVLASESPESKPRKAPPSSSFGRLPRACPLLAAAALAAERAAKGERSGGSGNGNGGGGGGSGGGWKNITTPTKPSPLSSPRASTPGSASSSASSTLLFSSSSSSLGGGLLCDREARRARRRAGLPAAAPLVLPSLLSLSQRQQQQQQQPEQQQQQQVSIQSFCRVLRRAGVGGPSSAVAGKGKASAIASPSKGGSRLARVSSKNDAALQPAAIAPPLSPAGKVLASPKKAGVTKGGKGGGGNARAAAARRGLGAALVAAAK